MGWRNPLARLPGLDVQEIHRINLLKGTALAFNDEEVDHDRTEEETAGDSVSISEINGTDNEGRA